MRKAILLTMAATIVAMFAVPTSASAAWTKHHATNASSAELEITGTDIRFSGSIGAVTCNSTISKVSFEANSTLGRINSFEPEATITGQCQGREAIAQCDVHEAVADGLPWSIHTTTSTTVLVTTGTITTTLTGFLCPHTLQMTPGTITWLVAAGEVNTTSKMSVIGSLAMDGDLGNNIAASLSGTFHVLGTITYGI